MPGSLANLPITNKPKLLDERVKLRSHAKGVYDLRMHYVYVLRSTSDDGFYIGFRRTCGVDSRSTRKAERLQLLTGAHGS